MSSKYANLPDIVRSAVLLCCLLYSYSSGPSALETRDFVLMGCTNIDIAGHDQPRRI